MRCSLVSPDGRYALAQNESELFKVAIDGSQTPVKINVPTGNANMLQPIRWLTENKVAVTDGPKLDLLILDLTTGKENAISYKTPAQSGNVSAVRVSNDMRTVAYSAYGPKSDLILLRGLH
jgi:hypothetical protein